MVFKYKFLKCKLFYSKLPYVTFFPTFMHKCLLSVSETLGIQWKNSQSPQGTNILVVRETVSNNHSNYVCFKEVTAIRK